MALTRYDSFEAGEQTARRLGIAGNRVASETPCRIRTGSRCLARMLGMVQLCQRCLRPAIAPTHPHLASWSTSNVSAVQQMHIYDLVETIKGLILRGRSAGRQLLAASARESAEF
jgi:hypothetical protein